MKIKVNKAKIGKRYCQFPSTVAANAAINGPQKDETAFSTCPAVNELASTFPFTTFVSNGFNDTCKMVLPIPSKAKAIRHVYRL